MSCESYLEHHGIKGMRWGVRRYQNPDGSLKAAGQKRNLVDRSKAGFGKVKSAIGRDLETRALRSERTMMQNEHFRKTYKPELDKLKTKAELAKLFVDNSKEGGIVNTIAKDTVSSYEKQHASKTTEYNKKSAEYANQKMLEKYGQKTMDRIEQQEMRDAIAIGGTMLAAFGAIGVQYLIETHR